jgi:hypothetical protein
MDPLDPDLDPLIGSNRIRVKSMRIRNTAVWKVKPLFLFGSVLNVLAFKHNTETKVDFYCNGALCINMKITIPKKNFFPPTNDRKKILPLKY